MIAARLFRYKVRRGLGVFYGLIAIMPILGIILNLALPLPLVLLGLIIGYLAIYVVARLSGFS